MATKRRATLEELHEFANKVREAGGGNPIDALMPSVPTDSSSCLIAKNLNFNCTVNTADVYGRSYWVMWVEDRVLRDNIAAALNKLKVNSKWEEGYGVVLPDHIGRCASDFDSVDDSLYCLRKGDIEDLSAAQKQLIREMWPYIEESRKEAYGIAGDLVNDKGEIII